MGKPPRDLYGERPPLATGPIVGKPETENSVSCGNPRLWARLLCDCFAESVGLCMMTPQKKKPQARSPRRGEFTDGNFTKGLEI